MKLKPIKAWQRENLQRADEIAREAQQLLRYAGANKAADAVARARKSIGGAIRHGDRRPLV